MCAEPERRVSETHASRAARARGTGALVFGLTHGQLALLTGHTPDSGVIEFVRFEGRGAHASDFASFQGGFLKLGGWSDRRDSRAREINLSEKAGR